MFPEIARITVDPEKLTSFSREDEFLEISFDLLRETSSYVCIAACIMGTAPTWTRNRAVIGGNMVRLFKLLSAFLDQTMQDRREIGAILARLSFETCVNVRYLVENFSDDLIDSYVRHSLRHERKSFDEIQGNIAERGVELPIETRMLKSLARTERIAGVPLHTVNLRDKAPWGRKHLHQRAQEVGLGEPYDAFFGGLSHSVHGSWQDIYQYHLGTDETDEVRFKPDLNWNKSRPQPLFALAKISVGTVGRAVWFLGGEQALVEVDEKLKDLDTRIWTADDAHEAYLTGKRWPEI